MQLSTNEIDRVEDVGMLNGNPIKMLKTKGGWWLAVGKLKGKPREEALTAGSHPAIVKYNLEKQFPDFQPNMTKSELSTDNIKVDKHSHFLSDSLRKSGYDIFSIQNENNIEFQITKHNDKIYSIDSAIDKGVLNFKHINIDKSFTKALAGAASEKAIDCGLKIKVYR